MTINEKKLHELSYKDLDVAEFLRDESGAQALLDDAFESGDANYMIHAIGIVSRFRNKTKLAESAGISRATLYNVLDGKGTPSFHSLVAVLNGLNFKISLTPKEQII